MVGIALLSLLNKMIKLKDILSEANIKHIDIWFEERRGRFYKVKINGNRAPREWSSWKAAQESLTKLLGWTIYLRSIDHSELDKAAKQLKKQGIKLTYDESMDVS
jgi:tRNA G10  N-methylase Trm11